MKYSNIFKRFQFPSEIIQDAVWLYYRFNLNHRDIEDLLAERGINVRYEAIRLWCNRFGPKYATRLKRKHPGYGDTFFIDEVFIKIDGIQHYLWRSVDQESLPHTSGANALGIEKSLTYTSKNDVGDKRDTPSPCAHLLRSVSPCAHLSRDRYNDAICTAYRTLV